MSTNILDRTELDEFQRYFNQRHGGTLNGHTLDEAVFRLYRTQLAELQQKIARSEESAERCGTIQLTPEHLEERLEKLQKQLT